MTSKITNSLVPSHPMTMRSKVSIVKLNPRYALIGIVDNISKPINVKEALTHKGWLQFMQEELTTLEEKNHT